jgi:exopolysaccharide biosynthesis protein
MLPLVRIRHLLPFAFLLLSASLAVQAQEVRFNRVKWKSMKIAPGINWFSTHSAIFDTLVQNVNILYIDTKKRKITVLHNPDSNKTVPSHMKYSDAIAGVNAGFFNIKEGGSVTYLRVDGLIADTDTAKKWKRNLNMNGAFITDKSGSIIIDPAKPNSWYDTMTQYDDILVTGCLLVDEGSIQKMPETSLVITRHPRTCAGMAGKHKLLLVTVDGRTDQSAGLSLPELAAFMKHLGCRDAVNLDGGGSTTMWIKGQPDNGIVNMPCDNRKFDHAGARAVANVIAVK